MSQAVRSAPGDTGDLGMHLERARTVIEEKFLAAGDLLAETIDGIGALIAGLDRLTANFDAEAVAQTTHDLNAAASMLEALPESYAKHQARMAEVGKTRVALEGRIADMRSTLAYMRAFTINIKVIAAGIPNSNMDFSLFAKGIDEGIKLGLAELASFETDLEALQGKLAAADTQSGTLGARIAQLFPPARAELIASAGVLTAQNQRIAQSTNRAADLARTIRKRVGRTLAALQIGDITRQRIEHVQHSLAGLDAALAVLPNRGRMAAAALMHALYASQIVATSKAFGAEIAEIERSMGDMARDAKELVGLQNLVYRTDDRKGPGLLHALEARISQVQALVADIDGADQAALATSRTMASALLGLNARVLEIQKIKTNVHYMALNTHLKCSQIGEAGHSLRVVVVELRSHSKLLELGASATLEMLDRLSQLAADITGAPDDDGAAVRATQTAAAALTAAGARISTAGTRTDADMAALVAQGGAVLTMLEDSVGRLAFQDDIGAILDQAADGFAPPDEPPHPPGDGDVAALQSTLAALDASYTMAQERDTHREFLRIHGMDAASPAQAAQGFEAVLF